MRARRGKGAVPLPGEHLLGQFQPLRILHPERSSTKNPTVDLRDNRHGRDAPRDEVTIALGSRDAST
jgi:hypothetical protein